ncbi:luciferin sulfotransferase-like [Spodoptera frugiperda]|uniref:Luciferin sulfotransferase-like n=1 Tax=Spodoptera frugiperda TaxID=7108 RepID=A0A9R0E6A4_SPOFR|nr:luciferin sulfotransferase-like [Spodoptera frugiperda]
MGEQKELPFPYETKELEPEEEELIKSNLGTYITRYVKLGPKGYMVLKPYMKDAANIYNMPLRPTDVFVASYQRSGTTWTQELVWLVANDLNYEKAAEIPLAERYPFIDGFMFFEPEKRELYADVMSKTADENFDREKYMQLIEFLSLPVSPLLAAAPLTQKRFIKTHLPMSLMPPKMLDTAKVVYVARDPRDVAVSCYHHSRLFKLVDPLKPFKSFWEIFYRGLFTLAPYFEHVKEAWEQRHNPNMLFLFYEELSKDLPASINRVADFLDKKLNEEEINRLCDHLSIDNFKKNKSVNFEEMREIGVLAKGESFIRKGKSGWRDYFDEEMTQQAEQWIEENLTDTDLRFPSMK